MCPLHQLSVAHWPLSILGTTFVAFVGLIGADVLLVMSVVQVFAMCGIKGCNLRKLGSCRVSMGG